jgi:PIN domain nuclease of toxin-antitoxin system
MNTSASFQVLDHLMLSHERCFVDQAPHKLCLSVVSFWELIKEIERLNSLSLKACEPRWFLFCLPCNLSLTSCIILHRF